MTISYSPIAKQFTMRADLSQLSGIDKASLFRALIEESGQLALFTNATGAEAAAQAVINAFWDEAKPRSVK